jgi:hypothetical protein
MLTLLAQTKTNLGNITPPTNSFSAGSETGSGAGANLEHFISNTIGVLTILGGLFFIFYFVTGGLNWVTAGGEQGKVTKARDQMVQAVIGMVVIVISYGLVGVVGSFLGLDLLHPATTFFNIRP